VHHRSRVGDGNGNPVYLLEEGGGLKTPDGADGHNFLEPKELSIGRACGVPRSGNGVLL
jgi:hypothetical protein